MLLPLSKRKVNHIETMFAIFQRSENHKAEDTAFISGVTVTVDIINFL